MKVEVNMSEREIAESMSAIAKREGRKLIKEELEKLIEQELDDSKSLNKLIKKNVMEKVDDMVLWWGHIDIEKDLFKDMTRRDIDYFASGARVAHSFDMTEKLGDERVVNKLCEYASREILSWVKGNTSLQNKLAVAIRETLSQKEEQEPQVAEDE